MARKKDKKDKDNKKKTVPGDDHRAPHVTIADVAEAVEKIEAWCTVVRKVLGKFAERYPEACVKVPRKVMLSMPPPVRSGRVGC